MLPRLVVVSAPLVEGRSVLWLALLFFFFVTGNFNIISWYPALQFCDSFNQTLGDFKVLLS